jgi:hypothetical protein
MSLTFTDAVPVKVTGTGRKAEENPYLAIINEIALKTVKVDGKDTPVAKAATISLPVEEDERKTVKGRIRRQLTAAGLAATTPCSVIASFVPVKVGAKGKETDSPSATVLTFWTVPVITRKRKPKDETVAL